jgi:hypothetical protein
MDLQFRQPVAHRYTEWAITAPLSNVETDIEEI